MSGDIHGLATKLGLATKFYDAGLCRREYEISDETLKFFIKTLGYRADTEGQIARSFKQLEDKR